VAHAAALQEVYGLSPTALAVTFGGNGAGIVACSQVNRALLRRLAPRYSALLGVNQFLVGAVVALTRPAGAHR